MLNEKPKLQQLTIKPFKIGGWEIRSCEHGAYCVWVKEEKKMKETNLEHYKEQLNEILLFGYDNHRNILQKIREISGCQIKLERGEHPTDAILEWMAQPYREPILDDAEKKYLSAVIKPFRNRVKYIMIAENYNISKQYLIIRLSNDSISFPAFKTNSMYKGMKPYRHYTLEELGL